MGIRERREASRERTAVIPLNDIRRAILESPDTIRMLMLTAQQLSVFRFVREQRLPVRSSKIANKFGLSPSHACMVMDALHQRGYVDRLSRPQESGGYEYEYLSQID